MIANNEKEANHFIQELEKLDKCGLNINRKKN
jgi:hypothetical protein